jgi:hypothetical protein
LKFGVVTPSVLVILLSIACVICGPFVFQNELWGRFLISVANVIGILMGIMLHM